MIKRSILTKLLTLFIFATVLQSCSSDNQTLNVEADSNSNPRPIYNKVYSFDTAKTLDDIYDVYTEFHFDYYPEDMDFVGEVSAYGFENPKLYFPEISVESEIILKDVSIRALDALNKLEIAPNTESYYDKEVLIWFIEDALNQLEHPNMRYFAHSNFGAQALVSTLLLDMHEIQSLEDAQAYVERVKDAGRYLNDIHDQVEIGIASDIMIPNSSAMNLVSELKAERTSIDKYKDKLINSLIELDIDDEATENILAQFEKAQENYLVPALDKLIDQTAHLMKSSPYSNGLSELPNGKDYYESYIIPHHVGLDLTAEEIHSIGLKEVERIKEEIKVLLDNTGYTGDLAEGVRSLQNSSRRFNGQEAFSQYQDVMDEIYDQLPKVFNEHNIPKNNPSVRFYDYNSYLQATIDGNRDAYFNIIDSSHASYAITALALHEASPGHHLQISNVLSDTNTKLLRKLLRTTSYTEGWALYAEKMALEEGFVKTDEVRLGMLLSELFRAGRLVVDTGLHYYDWTKVQAETYLKDEIFFAYPGFEVQRYMTMPGQALAYKMGELKIIELKQLAMETLGNSFSLKEFHSILLDSGYLPLNLLEIKLLNYVASNQ